MELTDYMCVAFDTAGRDRAHGIAPDPIEAQGICQLELSALRAELERVGHPDALAKFIYECMTCEEWCARFRRKGAHTR
jgi:hypothetical protein